MLRRKYTLSYDKIFLYIHFVYIVHYSKLSLYIHIFINIYFLLPISRTSPFFFLKTFFLYFYTRTHLACDLKVWELEIGGLLKLYWGWEYIFTKRRKQKGSYTKSQIFLHINPIDQILLLIFLISTKCHDMYYFFLFFNRILFKILIERQYILLSFPT